MSYRPRNWIASSAATSSLLPCSSLPTRSTRTPTSYTPLPTSRVGPSTFLFCSPALKIFASRFGFHPCTETPKGFPNSSNWNQYTPWYFPTPLATPLLPLYVLTRRCNIVQSVPGRPLTGRQTHFTFAKRTPHHLPILIPFYFHRTDFPSARIRGKPISFAGSFSHFSLLRIFLIILLIICTLSE